MFRVHSILAALAAIVCLASAPNVNADDKAAVLLEQASKSLKANQAKKRLIWPKPRLKPSGKKYLFISARRFI